MQLKALLLATLSLVAAAPLPSDDSSAMMGIKGALTNARQVQDTLNEQLQSANGTHDNAAVLTAFITGADSQIDNTIATVSALLGPATMGLSQDVGDVLLGPFVQSVTNGAEVFLANIVGGGADAVTTGMISTLTQNYSKLSSFAAQNHIDASKLDEVTKQIKDVHPGSHNEKRAAAEGIIGAFTNAVQVVETLTNNIKSGAPARGALVAFITGADSQIDNAWATLTDDLNGVTLGISGKLGEMTLGPFGQSVTNGAEVVITNALGGGIDLVTDGTTKAFSKSLSKLHTLMVQNNINSKTIANLEKVQKQVSEMKAPEKSKREAADGLIGSLTNSAQVIDSLTNNIKNGAPARGALLAFITGADSQIDNAEATLSTDLNGVTLGLSGKLGELALGPFAQSITNGAEVVISNALGGGIDLVTDGTAQAFSKSLSKLHTMLVQNNVNAQTIANLDKVQRQVSEMKAPEKSKRGAAEGIVGAFTNAVQVVETLTNNIKSGAPARGALVAFITGADSQIDNAWATLTDDLNGVTLGISGKLGEMTLGPFGQSVTNGAEVVITNALGGGIDLVTDGTTKAFSKSLSKLHTLMVQNNINSKTIANLEKVQKQVSEMKAPEKSKD